MANIRSEYIKNLMEDKEALNKTLQEATKDTLKSVVSEQVTNSLRSLLSESKDDDYEEEEVEDDDIQKTDKDTDTDDSVSDTESDDEVSKGSDADANDDVKDTEVEDALDSADADEDAALWDSLEQYKDVDGEYDLTGMDSSDVAKVLKVMKPEDGVRVVKKDDGTLHLTDDDNDVEYVIDMDNSFENESGETEFEVDIEEPDDEPDDESEIEVELDEDVDECGDMPLSEGEVDLGYTDNYQKDSAMTTPSNKEPGKHVRDWDKGVPHGVEKPWAGKAGNMSPYKTSLDEDEESIDEEPIIEVVCDGDNCVDDECEIQETAQTMSNKRTNREPNGEDNGHARKGRHRNKTGISPTMNDSTNEAIIRKAKAIFRENRQLKQIAEQIKNKLHEACVINSSLGKIIKLVTENTTTRDEKINIVNRFNNVKTINEGKELFNRISNELKQSHAINNMDNVMNGQLSENKKTNLIETSMYQSHDLANTLDLMERLNKIK